MCITRTTAIAPTNSPACAPKACGIASEATSIAARATKIVKRGRVASGSITFVSHE